MDIYGHFINTMKKNENINVIFYLQVVEKQNAHYAIIPHLIALEKCYLSHMRMDSHTHQGSSYN